MAEARRWSGRLLLWANLLFANAAAATFAIGFVKPAALGLMPAADGNGLILPLDTPGERALLVATVLLLLLNGLWLLRRKPALPPWPHVLSLTPSGPVRVAREALEAGLRSAGESLPEITRLRVLIDTGYGKRIVVQAQFQCAEGVSNLTASQRLRTVLQDRFHAIVQLGDGARADFDLEFLGFAGKMPKKAGEVAANLEPEPQPFTGPRYPIEEDDAPGGRL